jgi:hypothetical protein
MKLIIHIKDTADVFRIAGYIGALPHKADWSDVVESMEKDDEEAE